MKGEAIARVRAQQLLAAENAWKAADKAFRDAWQERRDAEAAAAEARRAASKWWQFWKSPVPSK